MNQADATRTPVRSSVETEDVPVGEECGGAGREPSRPPAVGQEQGGPASREEQGDDTREGEQEPASAAGHGVQARTPWPASQLTTSPR